MEDLDVRSPCISVCRLDQNNICVGCCRTVDEIREWYRTDNAGRRAILEELKKRNPNKR